MKLVIDIPENLYKAAINGLNAKEIWELRVAIKNGTPLPKGHGRLIDADDLDITTVTTDDYSGNDVLDVVLKEDIDDAPTIIEADGGDAE